MTEFQRWFIFHVETVSHYKCPLCDMTCPSPSSLRSHIKFRHSNEKPYSCDYCEYRYHLPQGRSSTSWDYAGRIFTFFLPLLFSVLAAVRIWLTCGNTWTPTAAIRPSTATFPGVASRLARPAPWRFTTKKNTRLLFKWRLTSFQMSIFNTIYFILF